MKITLLTILLFSVKILSVKEIDSSNKLLKNEQTEEKFHVTPMSKDTDVISHFLNGFERLT